MTIVQHIKRHLARMGRTIPLPEDKYRLIGSAYSIEERLVQERQRMVTADEIAPHIGTLDTGREVKDDSKDAADIRLVLAIGKGSVSLSKPIFNDPENISLQDMLEDKEEDIPAAAVANIQADLLTRILGWLNEPEKRLISALYGLSGQEQLTIKAASEMLGISQKTVVKTRNEILEKLRTAAQDEGLGV
jgi:DNA-directed RNA polymerase sigma subunit (sigma70/sigma32)